MIQDIAPFHFNNEWHKLQPEENDWIICMQERKILLRGTKEDISFPRYHELKEQVQNGDRFVYLFAVGGTYFLGIHMGLQAVGAYIAMAGDECARAVGMVLRWKGGKWKSKSLVEL